MSVKDSYIQKLKAQLDEWDAEIDRLKAKADQAEADLQLRYYKEVEGLRKRQIEARDRLDELRRSGEGAWEEFRDGVEKAWDELERGVKSALSRF